MNTEMLGIPAIYFLLILALLFVLYKTSRQEIKTGGRVEVKWYFPGSQSWQKRLLEVENNLLANLPAPLGGGAKKARSFIYFLLVLKKLFSSIVWVLVLSLFLMDWLGWGKYWWLPIAIYMGGCLIYGVSQAIKQKESE